MLNAMQTTKTKHHAKVLLFFMLQPTAFFSFCSPHVTCPSTSGPTSSWVNTLEHVLHVRCTEHMIVELPRLQQTLEKCTVISVIFTSSLQPACSSRRPKFPSSLRTHHIFLNNNPRISALATHSLDNRLPSPSPFSVEDNCNIKVPICS